MLQTPSTRWCPTPEQLMILEEMYKSGVRTPNSSQIQHITANLSFYGRIEGKNVFYWFQNHKARDRQKLRRRLSRQHHQLFHGCYSQFHSFEDASFIPTTQLYQYPQTTLINFVHQRDPQEKAQGMNLLCKLETNYAPSPPDNVRMYDWMRMTTDSNSNDHPSLKTLKTLDLFPTKSTGLGDECGSTSTY